MKTQKEDKTREKIKELRKLFYLREMGDIVLVDAQQQAEDIVLAILSQSRKEVLEEVEEKLPKEIKVKQGVRTSEELDEELAIEYGYNKAIKEVMKLLQTLK